jgi:hypothetical protein
MHLSTLLSRCAKQRARFIAQTKNHAQRFSHLSHETKLLIASPSPPKLTTRFARRRPSAFALQAHFFLDMRIAEFYTSSNCNLVVAD